MENITLEQILECCQGQYFGSREDLKREVTGIVTDSRKIVPGNLFVPLKGEKTDGHKYIPQVLEAGALASLSENVLSGNPGNYILVESALEAMQRIAAFYRNYLGLKVVGITGSVGKTSTKEMIASVLKERYKVHKTAGNFNNHIGLPLTIFGLKKEHEVGVLEMGISDFGEMHTLASMSNPDICVLTNIGLCHLENLKTRDGILKAKTECFQHMRENGRVILNGLDDKLNTIKEVKGSSPVFYGREGDAAYATDVTDLGLLGIRIHLHLYGEVREVTIPIPGEHNIYNALAAACVGHELGMDIEEICRGIQSVETIGGRSNLIQVKGMTLIDDCYNANPVSMKASIDVLSKAPGRKIAVLGDMGELGKEEKELHAQVGTYLSEKNIDHLFCAGELSREMAREAKGNPRCTVEHFSSKEDLIPALLQEVKEGDTILVKASHFMEYPKIIEALRKR
ncbi:UDP-N-acetylmuramoyl-tripeptide--D-alanyl-D-alanine ligase [Lachnospiraceae bacterium 38-14]|uniref:UDP-N-acetylmuramoyl-tripeptide--D-alanyl-D- alanine ligase n=1 Tax=Roseburia sp. 1XD42-69 TaxID=2320088 RepID=UPI000EA392A2|nr:UDP-N-acetylmuramoyl-tripeptide--D-alanyl-D-alanine ligase [Roseburia sp. 1XD42-69]RKJ63682.1 UDP-N-acetylmuramoyl-tripeptide--D-alanyl-D-alanine ligase [Roseburia sp. 1XD42-69]